MAAGVTLRRNTADVAPGLPGVPEALVDKSFEHCRLFVKREGVMLLPAFKLAPEPRRSALCALYAWLRRIEADVDTVALVEARRQCIDRVREQTDRAHAGDPPLHADPLWPAFASVIHAYRIPPEWTQAVLDAVAWRLGPGSCADEEAFRKGVLRFGSTLGMMTAAVCGLSDQAEPKTALALFRRRGAALQLIRILRDLALDYDAHPRRLYLPADSFTAAKLRPHELRAWMDPSACEAFIRQWCQAARDLLAESAPVETAISPDCAAMARTLGWIGAELLGAIEAKPSRVVRGPRAELPRLARTRLALAASMGRGPG